MRKKIVDGHMTVTAKAGHFVSTPDRSVYGKTLSLGCNVTADEIIELPESEFPQPEENEEFDILNPDEL